MKKIMSGGVSATLGLGLCFLVTSVGAQNAPTASDGIAKYREMIADGNPAELYEAEGEQLWKKAAAILQGHQPRAGFGIPFDDLHGSAARHRPERNR